LFHLPSKSVETPNIAWAKSKKLEIPKNLPLNNGRVFALTDFRNTHIPFGIQQEDRRRHMYILGKTGSGKTTLLKTMIAADIREGKGVAVIDPHGDLIEELLDLIPEYRKDDVVWLDPSDTEYPVGLNMLDLKENETMELLADGIVSVFKKFFGNSWGPRLQYILANVILTLLHTQNVSLLAVQRILIDRNYRIFLLKQVKDPFILQFWEKEFEEMSKNARLLTEAIAPIQNKVGRFLNSSMVRNMIGQVKSTIDLPQIMNESKILLVNLSQGKIGEENSSLLGGMIVTRLYTNAMQRAFLSAEERNDFYVYVDEFQNFATETFIKILSEARKYGLNLIVTHQYIDQLAEEIQKSIFGNVGTMMNYVVGQHDATRLAGEYAPYLDSEDLVNLEKYRLALKMMIDGAQSPPFTAIALPPDFIHEGLSQQIKMASREKFAHPRDEIELKLNKWSNQRYNDKGNLMQKDQPGKKKDDDVNENSETKKEKTQEPAEKKEKDNNSNQKEEQDKSKEAQNKNSDKRQDNKSKNDGNEKVDGKNKQKNKNNNKNKGKNNNNQKQSEAKTNQNKNVNQDAKPDDTTAKDSNPNTMQKDASSDLPIVNEGQQQPKQEYQAINTPVNIPPTVESTDESRASGVTNSFESEMGLPGYSQPTNS
ncbi:type IV secretion system DNA-binding domain-containing protein, partial [Candidatus Dojkabacteria bacterium]|nr:type IV secretion system DNA-binding domain-containing protein [Candidatus Dojkabacteria bacterium]